jgi:hypothetical protein
LVRPAGSTNSAELIADFLGEQVGGVIMHRSIGDYRSLLANAVSALENGTAEAREELYERARAALEAAFDKLDPPPSELEVERFKLNFAILDFEWSTVAGIAYAKCA